MYASFIGKKESLSLDFLMLVLSFFKKNLFRVLEHLLFICFSEATSSLCLASIITILPKNSFYLLLIES